MLHGGPVTVNVHGRISDVEVFIVLNGEKTEDIS